MTSPQVAGLRAHHDALIEATWKPILPRETWERLRALRLDPSRRTRVGAPARMLLTGGVLRCGKCGAPLRARPRTDGTRRYGCPPEGNHGYGCGGVARSADEVDAYVTEAVLTRLEKSKLSLTQERPDTDELADEMERIDGKLAEFSRLFADDEITRVEYDAATVHLRDRRKQIESRLLAARRGSHAAAIAGRGVRDRWVLLNLDQQRTIIRELLPGGVTLRSTGRGRWRIPLGPDLIELAWFDTSQDASETTKN